MENVVEAHNVWMSQLLEQRDLTDSVAGHALENREETMEGYFLSREAPRGSGAATADVLLLRCPDECASTP